jgi:4'-phosphopantetheinyl transferase
MEMEIGIDIEKIRYDFDTNEVAQQFFSKREIADLTSLPEPLKHKAFFDCWTRKEAYIKGIGEGLSMPLDQFSVSVLPQEYPVLLHNEKDANEDTLWSLRTLEPLAGYSAAIATRGKVHELNSWQWINQSDH